MFFVPSYALFTYEKASDTPFGAIVAAAKFADPVLVQLKAAQPYAVMAVGLLQLRGWLQEQQWDRPVEVLRPYVESLPWGSREHPLLYSP
jgi:hypothetical protein